MRRLPYLAVEPHRQARRRHETLGLSYGAFTIVKDRGREHRRGVAVAHPFHQMLEPADPAARDHRHRHRIGNRPGQFEVEAALRPVAVHGGEQDLAGAEGHHLAGIGDRLDAGRLAAAMGEDLEALARAVAAHALRVDGDHDALGAEFLSRGALIVIALALSPIAVTYTAGFIALLLGCDLNEASVHACPLLGVNIGPLLYAMGLAVWFVSLTVMAGLLALVVLVIVFIVRTVKARRAKVDATGENA